MERLKHLLLPLRVPETVGTEVFQSHSRRKIVIQQLGGGKRQEHLSAVAQLQETRSPVERRAKVFTAHGLSLVRVQRDPNVERQEGRRRGLYLLDELRLSGQGGPQRAGC